ncbi:MAG: hypothetical protein J6J04_00850, partial [Oscillospiraceae bacterium]|nr:hypothetical protein [Oscillospiraceae bacterium]
GITVENSEFKCDEFGIRADGSGAYDLTMKDSSITAAQPIVIRNTTGAYQLKLSGNNTLTAGTEGDYQVIFTNGKDDAAYEVPTGAYQYITDDANSEWVVYPDAAYVAQIGEVKYEDFFEALEAAEEGDTITLLQPIVLKEDKEVDLKGLTVDCVEDVYPAFRIQNEANVTFQNGTVTNSDYVFVLGASDGSSAGNLTIKDGNYKGETTVASVTKGTLTIEGGEFAVDPYEGNYNYLLNCIDANYKDGTAKIEVKGGTFNNFDPANNAAEGPGTNFVVEGYVSVDNGDGTWTVKVDDLFDIYAANIRAGDSLDMFFYVQKSDLDGDDYYAEIIREYADEEAKVIKIPYSEWEEYNSNLIRFGYDQIAAKEMTDALKVTVYKDDGTVASHLWLDSVRDYAVRSLTNPANSSNVELLAAMVDMLNYGAASQEYFGYHTDDLANSDIDAYQQYATESVESNDYREAGTNFAGSTVSAKSKVMLTLYFKNITPDMTAKVSYTNHYGTLKSWTVSGSDFVERGSMYGVDILGMSVADGRQLVTCEIIDVDGTSVVASAKDSIESYAARMGESDKVFVLLMKFVQSAYNYFH